MENNLNEIMTILNKAYQENKDNPAFFETIRNISPDGTKEYKFYVKSINIPHWYSSHLTLKEMAEKAGVSHERIRQIIASRNLPKPNPPKLSMTMSKKPLEPWYDASKSIEEMALAANKHSTTVRSYIKRWKLPYRHKGTIIDKVYDPNRTIDEMYAAGNGEISKATIRAILIYKNLKYVKVCNYNKSTDIYDWYDANLTISEMAKKSGRSNVSVYSILRHHGLKFNKRARVKNIEEWYDPELSINEMASLAQSPYSTIKSILSRLKLPFKRSRK